MCSVGGAGGAELNCSVLEEDWQRGQSYMAHWHSIALVPQLHHRPTMTEVECSAEHREARRLLQRFLSGAISKNYPRPKTHSARRPHQPVPEPSAQRDPVQVCSVTTKPKNAVTIERKTVVKITQLPRFLG